MNYLLILLDNLLNAVELYSTKELSKLIVYNPYAKLWHYESKSRGYEDTQEKRERFKGEIDRFNEKWGDFLKKGDPYYNINLRLDNDQYAIKEEKVKY